MVIIGTGIIGAANSIFMKVLGSLLRFELCNTKKQLSVIFLLSVIFNIYTTTKNAWRNTRYN